MSTPRAVIISDVHYNPQTLELADAAVNAAIKKAKELNVPLVIAGDLHDTKANLRGECVNRMIKTFAIAKYQGIVRIFILIGNHDLVNEKGAAHSLNFLRPYVTDIIAPGEGSAGYDPKSGLYFIPYQSTQEGVQNALQAIPKGATIIMHQGIQGAEMGHYVQDKSAVSKELFKDYRVVSGHYHRHQTIQCAKPRRGDIGLYTYVGNPYTLSFGEADHPAKGYGVLYDDGRFKIEPLNMRRHYVLNTTTEAIKTSVHLVEKPQHNPERENIIRLKVVGPQSELDAIDKTELGMKLFGHSNYKLDKIPTDSPRQEDIKSDIMTEGEVLDKLIDGMPETVEQKAELKKMWRELV